ncbi:MAG: hypothetical protein CEE42_05730 [Promethearchaeota archaeon Loki_b31]|nr:MAG: hypothetical protein CEE42_05730 [Candidatus Lokiarchaeota archaeon Loki_b31]
MELFQVFWDDQRKLFLEFKKNDEEQVQFLPDKIKRLNFQFEVSKIVKQEIYYKQSPSLVSIKKIYHSNEFLCFTIELDEIQGYTDIQIKVLKLTIYLYSGHRIEYIFSEKFNILDIGINDDCYDGFQFIDLSLGKGQKRKVTQERVVQSIKTDYNQNKEERTIIYEKNSIESISADQSVISMMKESNDTLKNIELYLKNLTLTMQNMSVNPISYGPPIHTPQRVLGPGIERIKRSELPSLIQSRGSSAKLLVIKEMKTKFREITEKNKGFSVTDILKPMNEDELKAIVLSDEELRKKEEIAINNQIKRFKKKQEQQEHKENKIKLKKLNKPK